MSYIRCASVRPFNTQGVFLDTDGSFLNSNTLPSSLIDTAGFDVGVPGTTWQSAVRNELFNGIPEVGCLYCWY